MTDITDLIARVRELQAKANPPQTPGYVRVGEANLTEWAAVIDEIPALATECERLRERVARLEEALRATVELAEWMSGSSDFDALGNWAEGRATCDNSRRILEGC